MSNSCRISPIVHHEHIELSNIIHNDRLEAIGVDVTGGLVTTVSNARHGESSLESTSDATIDTLGFTPGGTGNALELIGLVTGEFFGALFDDCLFVEGLYSCHCILFYFCASDIFIWEVTKGRSWIEFWQVQIVDVKSKVKQRRFIIHRLEVNQLLCQSVIFLGERIHMYRSKVIFQMV